MTTPTAQLDDAKAVARSPAVLATVLLVGSLICAVLVGLGLWQLQRLGWKQDLMARVEQRLAAPPAPVPTVTEWPQINRGDHEYRRIEVRGVFRHDLETLVQASTELGSGFWVLTPMRTEQGEWVIVNRGFVPPDQVDRSARSASEVQGVQQVQGLLRLTEPAGRLWQHNDASQNRWYSRDVAAIAAARQLGRGALSGPVAPFFIDAIADPSPNGAWTWPRGGLTVLHFSNNHLVYALTWFALAAMLAGAMVYLLREDRKQHRIAGVPPVEPSHG